MNIRKSFWGLLALSMTLFACSSGSGNTSEATGTVATEESSSGSESSSADSILGTWVDPLNSRINFTLYEDGNVKENGGKFYFLYGSGHTATPTSFTLEDDGTLFFESSKLLKDGTTERTDDRDQALRNAAYYYLDGEDLVISKKEWIREPEVDPTKPTASSAESESVLDEMVGAWETPVEGIEFFGNQGYIYLTVNYGTITIFDGYYDPDDDKYYGDNDGSFIFTMDGEDLIVEKNDSKMSIAPGTVFSRTSDKSEAEQDEDLYYLDSETFVFAKDVYTRSDLPFEPSK